MRKLLILSLFIVFGSSLKLKPAYRIFDGQKAKSIDYDKMIKGLKDVDVIFFGELHSNSICHWLQLQVLKSMTKEFDKKVVFGAEMFEADDQVILNEYLNDLVKESHLLREAKLWDNYKTDYAPMIHYAKEHDLQVIATNIPRRYASIVARSGFEGLDKIDPTAKRYFAPLPIEVPYEQSSYKEMSGMMGGHGSKKMIDAQAIKDATMAHFISKNLSQGSVFYHINGTFHTKNKEGIVHYLSKLRPELNIATITMVEQNEIKELDEENEGLADFIVAIPNDMIKTY